MVVTEDFNLPRSESETEEQVNQPKQRKRRATKEPTTSVGGGEVVEEARISIVIDKDNNILWDRMRSETKGRIQAVLQKNSQPDGPIVPDAVVARLFDAEVRLKGFVWAKAMKAPGQIADQVFRYPEELRDKQLVPAAQLVLKRLPPGVLANADWMGLVIAWGMITTAQLEAANTMLASYLRVQHERAEQERAAKGKVRIMPDGPQEL